MDIALYFFVPAGILAALLANIGIWAPRETSIKIAAIAVVGIFLPLSYASVSELLSRPKPVSLEWVRRAMPEATLLGASMREGTAIYLWLQIADTEEPRAYQLPWNKELAKQLQSAQRQAKKSKNGVRVRRPFDGTIDPRERMFYAAPRPPLPNKPAPDEVPLHYARPDSAG